MGLLAEPFLTGLRHATMPGVTQIDLPPTALEGLRFRSHKRRQSILSQDRDWTAADPNAQPSLLLPDDYRGQLQWGNISPILEVVDCSRGTPKRGRIRRAVAKLIERSPFRTEFLGFSSGRHPLVIRGQTGIPDGISIIYLGRQEEVNQQSLQ